MAYRIPYQYLAPGAAMMPRANPIPFAQIMENKKFKTKQLDKLADKQSALLDSMNVMASNRADADIIKGENDIYKARMGEIADNKKLNTGEKYRQMQLLGSEVKNNEKLNAITNWREKYEANKKMIEEAASKLDEDVSTYAMEELKRKNELGAVGIREHYPNMGYEQWTNINPLTTPDIGKRAKDFLEGIKADTDLISKDGAVIQDGKGKTLKYDGKGWWRADKNKYVDEAEALEIATEYIEQAPDIKEWFAQKNKGAEIALREGLALQGKSNEEIEAEINKRKLGKDPGYEIYGNDYVFDKDAYIKASVSPAGKLVAFDEYSSVYKTDQTLDKTKGSGDTDDIAKPLTTVFHTQNTVDGKETTFQIEDVQDYAEINLMTSSDIITASEKLNKMEEYKRTGKGSPVTEHQIQNQRGVLQNAIRTNRDIENIENTYEEQEKLNNTSAGKAITILQDINPESMAKGTDVFNPFIDEDGNPVSVRVDTRTIDNSLIDNWIPGNWTQEEIAFSKNTKPKSKGGNGIPATLSDGSPNPEAYMWNYTLEQYDAVMGGTDYNSIGEVNTIRVNDNGEIISNIDQKAEQQIALTNAQMGLKNLAGVNLNIKQTSKVLKLAEGYADQAEYDHNISKGGTAKSKTTNQEFAEEIFGPTTYKVTNKDLTDYDRIYSDMDKAVENGKLTAEEATALKAFIPAFSKDHTAEHMKTVFQNAVLTAKEQRNNGFDDYLTNIKPEVINSSQRFLNVPIVEDLGGEKFDPEEHSREVKMTNIVNAINDNKDNFIIRRSDHPQEKPLDMNEGTVPVTNITFKRVSGIGMDDIKIGDDQFLPIEVEGSYQIGSGNDKKTVTETFILSGDRNVNEAVYHGLADFYANTPTLRDSKGNSYESGEGELPFIVNTLRNKDKIGENFEKSSDRTKIGNEISSVFNLITGDMNTPMDEATGFMADESYSAPSIAYHKTGKQNYIFEGKGAYPLAAMTANIINQDPEFTEVLNNITHKNVIDVQNNKNAPVELQNLVKGLWELKLGVHHWKETGGRREFNSITDAKIWLNNMQENYVKIYNGLNNAKNVQDIVTGTEAAINGKRVTYSDGEFTVHE